MLKVKIPILLNIKPFCNPQCVNLAPHLATFIRHFPDFLGRGGGMVPVRQIWGEYGGLQEKMGGVQWAAGKNGGG